MDKDILLYGYIWEYSAMYFHDQIKEATEDDPEAQMVLRVNTEGGSPDYMMSIIAKFQSMADQFELIGEAQMHSAGFFLMCYTEKEKISVFDTTKGVLHRASYGEWLEGSASFAGSMYEQVLTKSNADLQKALRARVDVEALEALPQMVEKNLKVKDIFRQDQYNEVLLTAADMKKIGLVGKIIQVTPKKKAEVQAAVKLSAEFKSCRTMDEFRGARLAASAKPAPEKEESQNQNTTMDLKELQEKHPALYAQVIAAGKAEGLTAGALQEQERVAAFMVFAEYDAEGVKAGIESGKPMTMKQQSEFLLKAQSAGILAKVKKDNPAEVTTEVTGEQTEKQKELTAFMGNVNKFNGIGKKAEQAAA